MAIGTTNAHAPFDQKYYDRVLLERALPYLAHEMLGQQKPLKSKNGKTISFRRFSSLPAATTALSEGVTPSISDYTVVEVTATVAQYGYVVGVTDMVDATKPDPHLTELNEMLGEQMGNTKDRIIRDAVVGTSSTTYYTTAAGVITAASGNLSDADTILDETHLELAYEKLRTFDAPHFTNMIRPGPGIASFPIRPSYWAIAHPVMVRIMRGFTNWVPIEAYSKDQDTMPGEVGACAGIRFLESTNAKTTLAGVGDDSVGYYIPIFAPNAFGVVPLDGMSGQSYFQDFGTGDDTLKQRAKAGWKGAWTATVLNDAFMLTLLTLSATDDS